MQLPAAGQAPQDVDDAHVQLVAHGNRLRKLFSQVQLEIGDFVHDHILEALAVGAGHPIQIVDQELPLAAPMLPLGRCDPSLPLLEEGSAEVARSTRELRPLKRLFDHLPAVEHDDGLVSNEDGKYLAMLLLELDEGLGEVPRVEEGERA